MAGKIEARLSALERAVAQQQAPARSHRFLLFEQTAGDHVARLMTIGAQGLPAGKVDFSDSDINELVRAGRRCVVAMKTYDDDAGADRQ